jgi:hypothetical protein
MTPASDERRISGSVKDCPARQSLSGRYRPSTEYHGGRHPAPTRWLAGKLADGSHNFSTCKKKKKKAFDPRRASVVT